MKGCVIRLLLLLFATPAFAQTYYVRTGGDDSHTCTQAQTNNDANAKLTIAGAYGCISSSVGAGANKTVHVGPGVFTAKIDYNDTPGPTGTSWGAPFTIEGESGATTIRATSDVNVRFSSSTNASMYLIFQNFIIDAQNITNTEGDSLVIGTSVNAGSFVRILNNEFINNVRTHTIFVGFHGGTTGVEILNNKIHGGGFTCTSGSGGDYCYPMYVQGFDSLIEGNEIYDFPSFGIHINEQDNFQAGRWTVRRNYMHDFGQCEAQGNTRGTAIIPWHATDNLIYNNIIKCGMQAYGQSSSSSGNLVYNNTIYDMRGSTSGASGIDVASNTTAKNNIMANITGGGALINTATGTIPSTVSDNLCPTASTGCSVVNNSPTTIFVNAAGGDFHLKSGSPAINQGVDLGTPFNIDYALTSRPIGPAWDMGAYEFGAVVPPPVGPPTLTPNPPVGIVVSQAISVTVDDDDVNERIENVGDWVGIFLPGALATSYVDWFYMSGTKVAPSVAISDALINFTAPSTPGSYEFRFYQNDSNLEVDRLATAAFTVGAQGLVFKYNGSSIVKMAGTSQTVKVGVP